MKSFFLISLAVIPWLTASVAAQSSEAILKLLSPDARIIETAEVTSDPGKLRMLVLWMKHPERVKRPPVNSRACEDTFYGDHWVGPTRLSLIDAEKMAIINTIEIRHSYSDTREPEALFVIPFFGPDYWYYVPKPNAEHEGKPVILHLRDLTGEGIAGQFPIFEYAACGATKSSVLGYSPKTDQVVQYPIEMIEVGKEPRQTIWVPEFFQGKQSGPGRWDFTWEPGHGCFCSIRDRVSFDPARQVFVDRRDEIPGGG